MKKVAASDIGGVAVHPLNLERAVDLLCLWVRQRRRTYVCFCNIHNVVSSLRSEPVRHAHLEAGLTVPDGMPLVWILRARGYQQVTRVYGPDVMLALCAALQGSNFKHFFYGGAPGVAEQMAKQLLARYPRLQLAGTLSPPYRPLTRTEDHDAVRRINESGANVVWVGLGCPKQELWMAQHRHRLSASLLLGVGYAFDIFGGAKPQAPVWMQKAGLEWCFRFIHEPARLWPRLVVDGPLFLAAMTLRLRRVPPTLLGAK